MKTLIILSLFLIIFSGVSAQTKLNELQSIKKTHIDFTKEFIYFKIHGLIEIDGHTFINDTLKFPIIFQANLDGISICDTLNHKIYEHRICGEKECKIIHLTIKNDRLTIPSWNEGTILTPGWFNNNLIPL